MENLKRTLKKILSEPGDIALLGIGSELRGDDACGVVVARQLKKSIKVNPKHRGFKSFIGATAPENITGEIKRFNPAHLVIVDAIDMGKKAGTIRLLSPEQADGISFCTHHLPLKILADYFFQSIGCKTVIIGIQSKSLDFGMALSREIRESARFVSEAIKETIENN